MNFSSLFQSIVALAKPMIGMFGPQAHSIVERWATIPSKDRAKLIATLPAEKRDEGEAQLKLMADAVSDTAVFFASNGIVDPD